MATTTRRRQRKRDYQLVVLLDQEDRAALDTIVKHEKLTQSDVVRRFLRAQARRVQSQSAAA